MFVLSGIYQLPFGKGKQFLNSANAFTDTFLGGWSVGTIISLDSGAALLMLTPVEMSPTRDGRSSKGSENRRECIHGQRRRRKEPMKQWLNPAAFAQPAPFTRGNECTKRPAYSCVHKRGFQRDQELPLV